jgi:hypothetical protein
MKGHSISGRHPLRDAFLVCELEKHHKAAR